MKVIDLLNKMADEEPLPDKVKLECVNSITKENCIYHFNPIAANYINDKGEKLTNATFLSTLLDLEIEIVEETKPIEELRDFKFYLYAEVINSEVLNDFFGENFSRIYNKINELVKIVNKLEKGDDTYE